MKTVSAKVPDDILEAVEEYAESHGMNTSQAVRQLIRTGIEREQNPHTVTLPMVLIWFGTFAVASQYTSASGLLGPMGIVAIVVGGGLLNKRIRDRLEEIYERRNSDANTDDSQSS